MPTAVSASESKRFSFGGAHEKLEICQAQPLIRLALEDVRARQSITLDPRERGAWSISEDGDSAQITWTVSDGADRIVARITLRPQGSELLAELALEHSGPRRVRRVQFPYVEWSPVHLADRLLMASSWGDDIPLPCQTIRAFCDAGGNRKRMGGDFVFTGDDEVIYTYPSIMAMQYMTLYNPSRSVYLACYGIDDATRTFNAHALGKYALALSVCHYPFVSNGEFASPPCSIAVLAGGWHTASELYAGRMRREFADADVPLWLRTSFHGWVEIMMKQEGQAPRHFYRDLPKIFAERVKPLGLGVLHVAGWSLPSFDNLYPDYAFNPELGSAEELRAACDAVAALGGRVVLYTNLRLVDPRSEFFRSGGSESVCLDEDGKPYTEGYGTSAKFQIACPSSEAYGDYFAGQLTRMIAEYGAAGAQTDQVSCNPGYFCFDTRHSHATPAHNFLAGLSQTLNKLRRTYRALNPDFFVWAEGCHERFGQHYDVHQGHGEELTWQIGESLPEQFSFVYPRAIVTGHAKTDLQALCHAHSQGKPFDVSIRNLEIPGYAELLADFVAVRRAQADFFLRGAFRDSVGLRVPAGVRAHRIDHPSDSRMLVNVWRPGAGPAERCATELGVEFEFNDVEGVYPVDARVRRRDAHIELSWSGPIVTCVFSG